MAKKLKVTLQMNPSSGDPVKKTLKVSATGVSVGDLMQAAGWDTKNKDFTVNGNPASLDTHVSANDILQAQERAAVSVSERPQGS